MQKVTLLFYFFSLSGWMWGQYDLSALRTMYVNGQVQQVLEQIGETDDPELLFLQADCEHKLGHFDAAAALYQLSLDSGCTNALIYLNYGICLHSMGEYELSDDFLYKAGTQLPQEKKIPYYRGANAYMIGDLPSAKSHLNEAVVIDRNYVDALYLLAACAAEVGDFNAARNYFNRCEHVPELRDRVRLNQANLLLDDKDYNTAIEAYSQLLESTDKQIVREALYFRGVCRFYLRDSKGACEDWTVSARMGDEDARQHLIDQCEQGKKLKPRKSSYMQF